jgi:hypothetical protein
LSHTYRAGVVPPTVNELPPYLRAETKKLEKSFSEAQDFFLAKICANAPARAKAGMIRYADGVNWDPGNGPGVYVRNEDNNEWVFVGSYMNAGWFGAKAQSGTDAYAALQRAFDAASDAGGGMVLIPRGTYWVSEPLECPSNVIIRGVGIDSTTIRMLSTASALEVMKNAPTVAMNGSMYHHVSDLTLYGNAATETGLLLEGANRSVFERIRVRGISASGAYAFKMMTWDDGSTWRVASRNSLRDLIALDAPNSLGFMRGTGDPNTHGCNLNHIERGYFAGYSDKGIYNQHGEGNNYIAVSCSTSNDNTTAIYINDTVCKLTACHVDSTAGASLASTTDAWGFPTGILDNSNTGIYISDTARGAHIDVLLGNGCRKRIDYESEAAFKGTNVTRWQYNWQGETRAFNQVIDDQLWIGTEGSNAYRVWNDAPIEDGDGGTTAGSFVATGTVQASASALGMGFFSNISIADSATIAAIRHHSAGNGTLGSGATLTDQYGYYAANLTNGTNNHGYYSNLVKGTGKYNFHADGTALNKLDGPLSVAGTIYGPQPAVTVETGAVTLTGAKLLTGIISYTGAAANLTLPTGTDLDTAITTDVGAAAIATNLSFDFSVINTGSGTATVVVNTNITALGALTVAAATSATFRLRKTATNTFIIYRLS